MAYPSTSPSLYLPGSQPNYQPAVTGHFYPSTVPPQEFFLHYANPVSQPEPDLPEDIRRHIDTLSTLCTDTLHLMRLLNLSADEFHRAEICVGLEKIKLSFNDLGRSLLGKDEHQKNAAEKRLVRSRISDLLCDVIVEGLEIDGRSPSDDDMTKDPLNVLAEFLVYTCPFYWCFLSLSLTEVWRRVREDDRLLRMLLDKLNRWFQPHMDNTLSEPQHKLLMCCLEFISDIAEYDNKGRDRLRQLNTTRVLTPYLKSADYNCYAAIALGDIVTEGEVDPGLVTDFVDAAPRLDYDTITHLVKNDAIRQCFVENGAVGRLIECVRQASDEREKDGYAEGLLYFLSQAGPDAIPEGCGQEVCQLALARRYYGVEYDEEVDELLASLLWNDATRQYLIQNGFVRQLMDRVRQVADEEEKEGYAHGLLYLLLRAGPDAIPEGRGQEVCQVALARRYYSVEYVDELLARLLRNDATRQYLIQNGFVRQLMDRVRQAADEEEKEEYAFALRCLLSEAERDVIPESVVRDLFQLVLETQHCHGWVHILLKNDAARQCLIQNGALSQLMDGVRQADDNKDRNKWLRVLKHLVLKAGRDGIPEQDALDLVRFVVAEFVSRAWDDNDDDDDDNNDDDKNDDSDNSVYSNLKALISRLHPDPKEPNLRRQEIARILGSGDGGDANARCGKRRRTHWSRDSSLDENECSESEGSLAKIRREYEATIQQLQEELARVKGQQSSSGETEDTDEENVLAAPKPGVYSQKRAEKYGMVQLVSGHQVYLYPSELKIALNDSRIERDLEGGKGRSKGKRSSKSDRSRCKYEQAQHASQNTYIDGCRLARKLLAVFFTREQRMVGSIAEEPKPPLKQLNKTVTDAILAFCREQDATTTKTKVRNAMASTLTELQYRIKNKRPADQ